MSDNPFRYEAGDHHKQIQLARAAAIEAYSNLEQQLCLQFADLMGSDFDKASLVFYRITNTFSRNRILQSLLEKEYGSLYKRFWGSLLRLIRQVDHDRNKIVHWHIIGQEPAPGEEITEDDEFLLVPHGESEEVVLTADDLWEFVQKTEHIRLQAVMFYLHHLSRPSPADRQANKTYEAFLQPCSYPPPKDNPGFHLGPIPGIPPQSSEE